METLNAMILQGLEWFKTNLSVTELKLECESSDFSVIIICSICVQLNGHRYLPS